MDPGHLERLLAELIRAEVRFLVVGGVACALNGHVRTTEDLDIIVECAPDNLERLLEVLRATGAGHARELNVSDFTDEEGAIRLVEDFPIDMFTRMGGLRYEDLLSFASIHDGDISVPYVNVEGLILLKQDSLREQDRIDVEVLRQARGEG